MRLLMTADAVGGMWTYTLELANALAAHGVQTTLATMGPQPLPDQAAAARRVPGLHLHVSAFKLEWMDDAWTDVHAAGDWLIDLAATVAAEIVHVNGYAHAALPWRVPTIVVGHSCVCSWSDTVGCPVDDVWLDQYRAMVAGGLCAADWVVAPSRAMLAALHLNYGPLRSSSVIANGRDAKCCRPGRKAPFVLSTGRLWDRAANVDALCAIADTLSWPVVILGDTMPGSGRLLDAEMADHLGRASIFALPARYEPFGLAPLEAALAGCALVLGNIASLRETWGDAAIYVDPDDHQQLHRAIEQLIADPLLRMHCAGRARRRALTYTPARMADAYIAIYRAVMSGGRRALTCAPPPPRHGAGHRGRLRHRRPVQ
jgi:glycogen(starch) synthase